VSFVATLYFFLYSVILNLFVLVCLCILVLSISVFVFSRLDEKSQRHNLTLYLVESNQGSTAPKPSMVVPLTGEDLDLEVIIANFCQRNCMFEMRVLASS
jgi:hypothetical protein